MSPDFFQRVIHYQQKHARPGMTIQNALQTNDTLLDEAWCRFFKKHNFLIGISIDEPKELHDAYRVNKGGADSFSQVMRGWRLLAGHAVEFNVCCTVYAAN